MSGEFVKTRIAVGVFSGLASLGVLGVAIKDMMSHYNDVPVAEATPETPPQYIVTPEEQKDTERDMNTQGQVIAGLMLVSGVTLLTLPIPETKEPIN